MAFTPSQNAAINDFWLKNMDNPAAIQQAFKDYGLDLNSFRTAIGESDPWRARASLAHRGVTGYEGELGGGKTPQQWQQEMNAYAAANGIQAPDLMSDGFKDLRYSDDPLGDWKRQNVGSRAMISGGVPWLGTNNQAQAGDQFGGGYSQLQANTENHWAGLTNQTLRGDQSWNTNTVTGALNTAPPAAQPVAAPAVAAPQPPAIQNDFSFGGNTNPQGGGRTQGVGGGNLGFSGGSTASDPYGPSGATPQAKPGVGDSGTANPWLAASGQALVDATNQNLRNTIMPGLRSGAMAAGQYGGSRQGIAEGVAAGQATTGIAGALSQLYGNAYNTDQANQTTRIGQANQYDLGLGGLGVSLGQLGLADRTAQQQYGLGVGQLGLANRNSDQNFALGVGQLGLANRSADQNYALGQGQLNLNANTANQNFYTSQRGQDLQQYGIGANMFQAGAQGNLGIGGGKFNLGQTYMNAPMTTAQQYSQGISPYSGMNSTQASAPGGGASQALGGAMAGVQLYNNFTNNSRNNNNAPSNSTYGQGNGMGWG